ncbi:MAG: tRNA (adenosine(37)-N6)-dimethylallyltransferase MiaA [Clostridia bacterium]|nr:tRNA (adenosine(37)-N6)-dimethylallyltransferase MiaA [Clostridia bacterium]
MSKVVVIVGPTASGKSALAIEVARQLNGAIVSADSMQIYRGLDVGTAKETGKVREEIPHFMIDVVDRNQEFSVSQFKDMASLAIEKIEGMGKLPIVVGGTGLYIEALLYPFSFGNAVKDETIRKMLTEECELNGSDELYSKLKSIDSESAAKLHPNDTKRIIRALEIFYLTGKTKTQSKDQIKQCAYDIVFVGLECDRARLYQKIDKRVDEMFGAGLLDEIKSLEKYDDRFSWQSMQAIGYKEFAEYYNFNKFIENDDKENIISQSKICPNKSVSIENCDLSEMEQIKEKIKKDSRNYAKRQLTWFRRYENLKWFDCFEEITLAIEYIKNQIQKI